MIGLLWFALSSVYLVWAFVNNEGDHARRWKFSSDGRETEILQNSLGSKVDPMACPVIVSREDWGARPPRNRTAMQTPVPFVILHHTYMAECFTYEDCCKMMRKIQNFHMDTRGWDDIGYSFLVGEDGLVFEGRGWGYVGAHAPWYNFRSIGVSIMGNYTAKTPNQMAVDAVQYIINCAVTNKKLDPDYILYGHRQATPNRTCPGEALFKEIQTWPHWKPGEHFPPS